ncbi:MAG: demethoxyubiquinone hydroxylase family protein [Alphaproteobacteria bacterium]|nr:MAG: demethoxyubiquinone hydroxylase family protein [Alphaproteobacteria bacterium]
MAKAKARGERREARGRPRSAKSARRKSPQIERIIRVDHAGEYGAKRIYQGQMKVLGKNPRLKKLLQEMMDHELEHLQYFENAIPARRVRPTALLPLWHMGGFAMGAITAMMGEKAAMACTVAVEEVIEQHYQKQLAELGADEPDLRLAIEKFCADEVHHRDIGLHHGAEQAPGYELLYKIVSNITKRAIWLSERI